MASWRSSVDGQLAQLRVLLASLRTDVDRIAATTPTQPPTPDPPEPVPPTVPWWKAGLLWSGIIGGAAVAVVGLLLRTVGVSSGVLYGTRPVQLVTALTAAGVTVAVACWWLKRSAHPDRNTRFTEALALLSAVVAVISLTGIFFPQVPAGVAEEGACPRVRIRQATFIGTVAADLAGVNARTDPTRAATQVDRYPAGCLIGFDGFCFGEPITDATYTGVAVPRKDVRWLRVAKNRTRFGHWLARWLSGEPNGERFIAGGVIQTRTLENFSHQWLGATDDKACPGNVQPPGPVHLELADPDNDGVVTLTGTAERASDIRFAVYTAGEVLDDVGRFRPVEPTVRDGVVSYEWRTRVTAAVLKDPSSQVVILGVPCIGPSIAPLNLASVDLTAGTLTRSTDDSAATFRPSQGSARIPAKDLRTLVETACQAIE